MTAVFLWAGPYLSHISLFNTKSEEKLIQKKVQLRFFKDVSKREHQGAFGAVEV